MTLNGHGISGTIVTEEAGIRALFERENIRYDLWNGGEVRTFQGMMDYVNRDRFLVVDQGPGKAPVIMVTNVVVYIWCMRTIQEELYEAFQSFDDGSRPPESRGFDGISETVAKDETLDQAVVQLLAEEPGYSEPGFRDPKNYQVYRWTPKPSGLRDSDKWPGLKAVYERNCFNCQITNPRIYHPEGYHEIRDGITTVFRWKRI
jgi:hypothetical protein